MELENAAETNNTYGVQFRWNEISNIKIKIRSCPG
jgi:hypothetical protein